jgi:hypothetical protein
VTLLPAPKSTAISRTGAVSSIQEAQVSIARETLEAVWRPDHLERLARTYWRYLTRVSLGVLRVIYSAESRSVVLLVPALRLLTFHRPEYLTDRNLGRVTWRIWRGLLVAREGIGNGYLRIDVRREGTDPRSPARELVGVRVEVENYYPWLRGSGPFARFGARLYEWTQLRIHVRVTRGFLHSLARLDLAPGAAELPRNDAPMAR